MKKMNFEKGIILYLSLAIMGILFSSALGINLILSSQAKMVKNIGDSVLAFYAAETGIERELYTNSTTTVGYSGSLGDSSYSVKVIISPDPGCPAPLSYCVASVGTYKTTSRAIYISR